MRARPGGEAWHQARRRAAPWLAGLLALPLFSGAVARAQAPRPIDPAGGLPPPGAGGATPERVVVVPIPPAQPPPRPFLMGFEFTHVLEEDGDLAHRGQSANAVGLRFVFFEGRAMRQHFALVHHWEQNGPVARRGFRLDLLSMGFPIPVSGAPLELAVEPILRVVRGEVLFVSEDDGPSRSLMRLESGFALAVSAAYRTWFFIVEPLSIDFRYLQLTRSESQSGFSRIWSVSTTIGRQF